jgi:hypothetical protein
MSSVDSPVDTQSLSFRQHERLVYFFIIACLLGYELIGTDLIDRFDGLAK